jgi:hypothetical protein
MPILGERRRAARGGSEVVLWVLWRGGKGYRPILAPNGGPACFRGRTGLVRNTEPVGRRRREAQQGERSPGGRLRLAPT